MQNRVLVAYASNAGSTAEIARVVGEELGKGGALVDLRRISDLGDTDLSPYSAVFVGAPMILGWHRDAERFVHANRAALAKVPTAFFVTALTLTKTSDSMPDAPKLFVDPRLGKAPRGGRRLGLKERYATLDHYLGPILRSAGQVKPASIAFFAGKLDFGRLKFLQMFFIMLILGAQPGDFRNWDAIRGWAREQAATLLV